MINKKRILAEREIDHIVSPFCEELELAVHRIIGGGTFVGRWDYDKFWEDTLSIFGEEFSKDEQ